MLAKNSSSTEATGKPTVGASVQARKRFAESSCAVGRLCLGVRPAGGGTGRTVRGERL